ncbi:hypothetical protein [Collimonas sp.]|nr:hypothetical protein [Collimonas sp.]HWW07259.1 hypothetical protein [Collimonas sp.]
MNQLALAERFVKQRKNVKRNAVQDIPGKDDPGKAADIAQA